MPTTGGDGDGQHYEVNTLEEKIIREYTGFAFRDLEELDVFEYWLYLRDAVVYNYSQSEAGLEKLNDCWRMEQVNPDRAALRNKFGKGDKS